MNKGIKRFLSVLLAVTVLAALGVSALADVPNSDQYTVTLSPGNVAGAAISGQTVWTVTAGATVDFGGVSLPEDSPYYFKGFRPAGRDNNVVYSSRIQVTEDTDYVACYGLVGDLVAYTVNYVLAGTDTPLAESQTYYGNVGDKSVVAYLYIDGYQPQALNLAKTLVADESQNVFTFEYSQIVVPTPEPPAPTATPYVYTEGAETPAEGGEPEEIGGEPIPEGEPEPLPEEPEEEPEQEPETEPETAEITDEQTPLNNEPEQMIDLDEEDTPLGGKPVIQEKPKTELQQEREQTQTNFYLSLGLLGVALVAIAALVVLLVKKKKS